MTTRIPTSQAVLDRLAEGPDDLDALVVDLDGRAWLDLDAAARRWGAPRTSTTEDLAAAVLAALHPDGHVRERAVRTLVDDEGVAVRRVVALRLLDHVPQVRAAAGQSLDAVVARDGLAAADDLLDVVLAGRERAHGPAALTLVEGRLRGAAGGDAPLAEVLLASPVTAVRRHGLEVAHGAGLLTPWRLAEMVEDETDRVVLARCADLLLAADDRAALAPLLDARSSLVRQVAVLRAPDDALPDDRLLAFALDPSARVRESARFRARRRGLDVLAFLHEHADDARAGVRAAVVEGLAERDEAVGWALDDPAPRVRAAALGALTAGPDDVDARLAGAVLDPSPRVARTAGRLLARRGARLAVLAAAWESPQPWSRRAAWFVGRSARGWDRLEGDLRGAVDPDLALARDAEADLGLWLRDDAATSYRPPSPEQRGRIAALLAGRDERTRELVGFHLGLPELRP